MKAKLSEIAIAPRESLFSKKVSHFRHSSIPNREVLQEKLQIQVSPDSSKILARRRQTIATTKETKFPSFNHHLLDKGYKHSMNGQLKASMSSMKLAPLNHQPSKALNPNRSTKFLQNRKNLASMIDGFRNSRASNLSENNFTVHPVANQNASAELLYESKMLLSQPNIDLQSSGLNPENFPRRKNVIMLPAFGVTYTLSSKKKPKINLQVKNDSSNVSLNNYQNENQMQYQMMKENFRPKSELSIFKKAKSQTELDSLWRNTLVVDPNKIKSKQILNDPPAKISEDISERINQNYSKMKELANNISSHLKFEMQRIVQPLKDEIRQKRHKLLKKIVEFLSFAKELGIESELILEFPTRSYQHPKSVPFIEYAKMGRSEKLVDLLMRQSKLLVYEYDNFRLTALHWAVIRDHQGAMDILIEWGSFINATDVYERTPLYYAIRNQNVYMVFEMLVRRASPWSPKDANYIELANRHEKIIYYIKKFRMMDLMMKFQKPSKREEFRSFYLRNKISRPF